ncbi:MAG: ABC transporter permease [Mycolicibacterium sp.]|uniref:ABC transporter permease n=1 Tax=Mycolicibacterium sp. TaxID=2320850 RepID=UPI003D0CF79A
MTRATISRLRLLNVRELRSHWGRVVASVGVVAVSAGLLVAVLGMSGSITGSAERLAESIGGSAEFEVSGITATGFDESLRDTVGRVDGVEAAIPVLRAQPAIHAGPGTGRVLLLGVDDSIRSLSSDLEESVRAQLQPDSALQKVPGGVVVGPGLGIGEGDRFELGSTPVTAAVVVRDSAAQRLNSGHFVVAPLPLAQQIAGRPDRLDSILIVTAPGSDAEQIRTAVSEAVAGRALVAEPTFRAAQASSSFAVVQSTTLLVTLTTFVIAAFLSYNAMTLAIAQRRPIISTMRALGGGRRTIVADLLSEAALLGFIAGLIGAVCGIALGRVAVGTLPPTLTQSLEARTEYILPAYAVPVAIAAAVATSVIASAVAARQVHRVSPVEALAPIGAGALEVGSRPTRIAAGVIGSVLVAAAAWMVSAELGRLAIASLALALTGATAIAFALSGPLMRSAAAVARCCGTTGILGATSIERAPRRVLVATITVMIAVANAASITGTNDNVVDSTLASFSSLAETDVWVTAAPATDVQTAPLPADTESRVRAVPGVQTVLPGQLAFATVSDTRVMILGVSPGSHQNLYQPLSEENRVKFDNGTGVVLSRDVARTMGVGPGGLLTMQSPTGERRVEVLDVLPAFAALYGTIAMNLSTMREWFSTQGATNLEISVAPGHDPGAVQRAIESALSPDVYVYSGGEVQAAVREALDSSTAAIFLMAWVIVAVSGVTLLNTLMLSVLDRRRQIGVLRAIGATRRTTLNVVVAEAIGVGVVGGTLGLVVGAGSQFLNAEALTSVLGIDVSYRPEPMMIVLGLGALGICLLGAIPPAIRAGRLNIVDAISVE